VHESVLRIGPERASLLSLGEPAWAEILGTGPCEKGRPRLETTLAVSINAPIPRQLLDMVNPGQTGLEQAP
jgi:hypothetical protein